MGKRQQVATRATIGRSETRRIAIGTRRLARRKTGRPTICANPGGPWERGIRTLGAERELSWPGTCERAVILERVLVYLYMRVHRWILYQCLDLKCSCLHLMPLARLQHGGILLGCELERLVLLSLRSGRCNETSSKLRGTNIDERIDGRRRTDLRRS